jgi:hypothetical protein
MGKLGRNEEVWEVLGGEGGMRRCQEVRGRIRSNVSLESD